MRARVVAAVAACAGLAASGCGGPARPNLLLIVIDTLRVDGLGCYGAVRDTSPALDALAADAARFERAYAPAPWTQPSVASLLTGLHPSGHGLVRAGLRLPAQVPTMAEILASAGYATGAVVSHSLLGRVYGFSRGFQRFDQSEGRGHEHVSTPGVTQKAVEMLGALRASGRPFFLFVHYFDPHHAYRRHPDVGFAPDGVGRLRGGESIHRLRALLPTLTAEELDFIRTLYVEEIRYTDEGIRHLLEALREAGVYEDTVIVVTGDHGEEFLEHRRIGHKRTLWEEVVRVPLILRVPGATDGGRVVAERVSTAGVMATALELLGLGAALPEARAPSLAGLLRRQGADAGAPVFVEVGWPADPARPDPADHMRTVIAGRHKLIRDDRGDSVQLFDLESDPGETRDLAGERPALVRDLLALLDRHFSGPRAAPEPVTIPRDTVGQLRALGYLDP